MRSNAESGAARGRRWLAIRVERAHANPVVERLQRQVKVFAGLQFQNHQPAIAVEGEQVEHAAIAGGERWHLGVEQVAAQFRQQFGKPHAQARLKPALGRHAEKRIGVRAIGVAAEKEAPEKIAAERFVFLG